MEGIHVRDKSVFLHHL